MNKFIQQGRSQWPRILSALPAIKVRQQAENFADRFAVQDVILPQSGLGLLQLRDSALGDAYFLGEIPIARAHVMLTDPDNPTGSLVEGAARILDDRFSLARSIAILDGVLAARLPGFEAVLALLEEGAAILDEIKKQRQGMLAQTRVDFSLLCATEEDTDV